MTSGVKAMFSMAISGVVMDRSSGVRALFPPSGGTREGNANLELGIWLQKTIEDALLCQAFQEVITFADMRGLDSTVDDVSDSWEELVTEVMSFSYVSLVLHHAGFYGDERQLNFKIK